MKMYTLRRLSKIVTLISISIISLSLFWACEKDSDKVYLTFSSWRTDDVEQMNRINALFTKTHPNIIICYQPVETILYNKTTLDNLAKGAGADIFFLRSYDLGRELYNGGYLYNLTNIIPNLTSYSPVPLKAWTTENGVTYGVPSVGVTEGVYYNKSIFAKYNIQEPTNWDDFILACEKLRLGGETVIAQGAYDNWTLYEVVFCGLGANFYGGEVARQALMAGTMKLTDANFIKAFKMVESLKKYLPTGFATLDYEDARELFGTGKAAIFIGGSWELSVFEGLGSNSSKIGWFAPPVAKTGDKLQYCFNVDAGIGINKNTEYLDDAIEYIKWVSGSEYANAFMNELPGFFSYTPGSITLSNPLAQEMYNTAATANLTVRLMVEKFCQKTPAGNTLMGTALNGIMTGSYTPETAAAYVQSQLDTWYKP